MGKRVHGKMVRDAIYGSVYLISQHQTIIRSNDASNNGSKSGDPFSFPLCPPKSIILPHPVNLYYTFYSPSPKARHRSQESSSPFGLMIEYLRFVHFLNILLSQLNKYPHQPGGKEGGEEGIHGSWVDVKDDLCILSVCFEEKKERKATAIDIIG